MIVSKVVKKNIPTAQGADVSRVPVIIVVAVGDGGGGFHCSCGGHTHSLLETFVSGVKKGIIIT